MYILLATVSAFFMALHLIFLAREMRRNPAYTPLMAMGTTHLLSGLLLAPLVFYTGQSLGAVDMDFYRFLTIAVLASLLSKGLYLYAYVHIDVAFVTVFSALTPVITLMTGWFFLQEMPAQPAVLGTLVIGGAIYYLFLGHHPPGSRSVVRWFWPFIMITRSRPVMCAFLSVLPPALAVIFQKKSVLLLDPLHYVFFTTVLEGALALLVLALWQGWGRFAGQFSQLSHLGISLQGITLCLAQMASTTALTYGLVANVISIQRIGIVFQTILAYYILKQKDHIPRKLTAAALIMFGFLLIASSHG